MTGYQIKLERRRVGRFLPERVVTLLSPMRNHIGVALALLALYLIWGSTYFGIRVALETLPPFTMAGVRFLIAGGALYLFARSRGAPAPTRAQWIGSAVVGFLLLGGGNGGVAFAEQWVSSGLAAVWVATVPLWVALLSGFLGRWPRKLEWGGLLLGFAGVGILNLEGNLRANPIGAIALTLATLSWAAGSVLSRRVSLPAGLMSSAAQMLAGSGALFILSLITNEKITAPPSVRSVLAVLYLAAFGSMIAFSAYAYLLRRVRPTIATSYTYVNPMVAVALGAALGGEHVGGFVMIAMLVILGGVALVMLAREKKDGRE